MSSQSNKVKILHVAYGRLCHCCHHWHLDSYAKLGPTHSIPHRDMHLVSSLTVRSGSIFSSPSWRISSKGSKTNFPLWKCRCTHWCTKWRVRTTRDVDGKGIGEDSMENSPGCAFVGTNLNRLLVLEPSRVNQEERDDFTWKFLSV